MDGERIIAQLEASGVEGKNIPIFLVLYNLIAANEDGRTAAAGRYIGERFGFSERAIRQAIKELVDLGWLKAATKAKRYTMISRGYRLTSDAPNGAESEAPKTSKRRYVSIKRDAESGAESGATGVSGVSRSSGVDVAPALSQNVKDGKPRATPFVHKSKSTSTARYQTAVDRAPDLPHVTMHIDRLFAEISRGKKYPWAGNRFAATILGDLIVSHGTGLVMAAAEIFFTRGDKWTEERAWSIDEFGKQFAKLIATDAATRRAVALAAELQVQGRPTTPRELKAQLAAMRRRAEQEFEASYSPDEVRFRADMNKPRTKEPAVV